MILEPAARPDRPIGRLRHLFRDAFSDQGQGLVPPIGPHFGAAPMPFQLPVAFQVWVLDEGLPALQRPALQGLVPHSEPGAGRGLTDEQVEAIRARVLGVPSLKVAK